jgi:hypothetical protein
MHFYVHGKLLHASFSPSYSAGYGNIPQFHLGSMII